MCSSGRKWVVKVFLPVLLAIALISKQIADSHHSRWALYAEGRTELSFTFIFYIA